MKEQCQYAWNDFYREILLFSSNNNNIFYLLKQILELNIIKAININKKNHKIIIFIIVYVLIFM